MRTTLPFVLLAAATLLVPAFAEGESSGSFGRWTVLSDEVNGDRACWVAAEPSASENPDNIERLFPMFMVAFYPSKDVRNEVSVNAGFDLAPGQNIEIDVGQQKYRLAPSGPWALSGLSSERVEVGTLASALGFTVKLRSTAGSVVVDSFDTTGLSEALTAAAHQCQISLVLSP